MTNNSHELIKLTIPGNPRRTEAVDVQEGLRQITLSLRWRAYHTPEHQMLLMAWDKTAMGNPSMFNIRASALDSRMESHFETDGVNMVTRKLALDTDGQLENLVGMYSQTLGPEREYTQFEVQSALHPYVCFYGQFSYQSSFATARPLLVELLNTLEFASVDEWKQ